MTAAPAPVPREPFAKKLRRLYIQLNWKKAGEDPLGCGQRMKAKGWFRGKTTDQQLEDYVTSTVQAIREEYSQLTALFETEPEEDSHHRSPRPAKKLNREELVQLGQMKQAGPGVDLIQAYRYLYYVQGVSVLSDKAYDDLEAEEKEFGAHGKILDLTPSSDRAEDYEPHIRALALYLRFKYSHRENE